MTATLQLSAPDGAAARREDALFTPWTRRGLYAALVPLLAWDAASVFMLALACHISWYVAWIPAISTSGVMLASSQIALHDDLDADVRRCAKYLAVFGGALGMVIAAVQHALPVDIGTPHWIWRALIGGLPVAVGGYLAYIVHAAHAAHARKLAEQRTAEAAAIAQVEQLRLSKIEAQATAERERVATQRAAQEAKDSRATERAAELAHANALADAARRQADAQATVTRAIEPGLHSVPDPTPEGPLDALGRKARPSEKRDAALRWLLRQHRDGRNLDTVTAAEVDRVINANRYSHKHLTTWIRDVRAHARKAA